MSVPFDPQPALQGDLLRLRPLRADDHDALFTVAADPAVWELHPAKERATPDGFRRFFDEALATGGALVVLDADTGEVIGSSRFHGHDAARREVEIGWTFLARRHWGGRVNGELKRLMLGHAFRSVDTVLFHVHGGNLRSQRAVEKLGAVREPLPTGTLLRDDTRLTFRLHRAAWLRRQADASRRRDEPSRPEADAELRPNRLDIRVDDLSGPEVAALLGEHLASMHSHSPPGSVHALDLDRLRAPGITFWTVWRGGELAGCGALKELDPRHGEVKSMRTARAHLRQGVAAALLEHMLGEARARGYRRVSLETGSGSAFLPAHALYTRFGFTRCAPFGDYRNDGFSICMTRELGA